MIRSQFDSIFWYFIRISIVIPNFCLFCVSTVARTRSQKNSGQKPKTTPKATAKPKPKAKPKAVLPKPRQSRSRVVSPQPGPSRQRVASPQPGPSRSRRYSSDSFDSTDSDRKSRSRSKHHRHRDHRRNHRHSHRSYDNDRHRRRSRSRSRHGLHHRRSPSSSYSSSSSSPSESSSSLSPPVRKTPGSILKPAKRLARTTSVFIDDASHTPANRARAYSIDGSATYTPARRGRAKSVGSNVTPDATNIACTPVRRGRPKTVGTGVIGGGNGNSCCDHHGSCHKSSVPWVPKQVRFGGYNVVGQSKPIPSLLPLTPPIQSTPPTPSTSNQNVLSPDMMRAQIKLNTQLMGEVDKLRKIIDQVNKERDYYKLKSSNVGPPTNNARDHHEDEENVNPNAMSTNQNNENNENNDDNERKEESPAVNNDVTDNVDTANQ